MANLMHRPCLYSDPATAWFMAQSKAALADMLTEVLRRDSGRCDDPATAEAAEAAFGDVVAARSRLRGLPKRLDRAARESWTASGEWNGGPQ
ncbi:MAG: hypothetical protein KGR24_10365 [Planctomycetes bacterium]|nr:hypothetical protein [Planctomycetota bacterium]